MRLEETKYLPTPYLPTPAPKTAPGVEAARDQIERLLASNTFHASDVLRRLLRFLADKSFSGEADELKEYSVGLDALGKPSTYDPRTDAAVRLHASRLRQKLDDYYRNEGKDDPLVIELPKGRFKIAWHPRFPDNPVPVPATPLAGAVPVEDAASRVEPGRVRKWRSLAIGFAAIALVFASLCLWEVSRASRAARVSVALQQSTPELESLWSPFLTPARHTIIAFINPLFVRLRRDGGPDVVYRTSRINSWDEVVTSPEFSLLQRSLGKPMASPTFNLVERSNLVATFELTQFFARRREDISLARADELSWQQFAENNVILFGPFTIGGGESALPVKTAMIVDKTGVRNLQPLPGEPSVYADPPDHSPSDGEGLELVSMLPGPLGRTSVVTFSSNHKWGVLGGVQALLDPVFVRAITGKLKESSGELPHYYQVLFKIKYRDGILTHASYVTHRALTLTQNSTRESAQ